MLMFHGNAAGFPLPASTEANHAAALLAAKGVDSLKIPRESQAECLRGLADLLDRVAARNPGLRTEPVRLTHYPDHMSVAYLTMSRPAGSQLRVALTMRPMAWLYGVRAPRGGTWVIEAKSTNRERGELDECDPYACELVTREERQALYEAFPPGVFNPVAFLDRLAEVVTANCRVCPSCGEAFRGVDAHIRVKVQSELGQAYPGSRCAAALGYKLSYTRAFRSWGAPTLKTIGEKHAAITTMPMFSVEYRVPTTGRKPRVETLWAWPKFLYGAVDCWAGKVLSAAAENYYRALRDCPEVAALFDELAGKDFDSSDIRAMGEFILTELRAAGFKPKRVVERKPKPKPDFTFRVP